MKVASLIRMVHTKVSPDAAVEKVWKMLAKRNITLLSVVSHDNDLIGVIGEDDLLYRLVPDYREYFSEFIPGAPDVSDLEEKLGRELLLTASDVMNKNVITVGPDQPIYKALSKMMAHNVRVLPVVSEEKKFLGMIFEDDIMQYLFKNYKTVVRKRKKSKSQI